MCLWTSKSKKFHDRNGGPELTRAGDIRTHDKKGEFEQGCGKIHPCTNTSCCLVNKRGLAVLLRVLSALPVYMALD
jgi:hypothetical protein